MRSAPKSAPSSNSTTPATPPLDADPEALETLRRGFRMASMQCWGAVLALGLDETVAREVVYRAGSRAIDPEEALRCLRPETWSRRIQRLEGFVSREFAEAIEASGIPRSPGMHSLAGRANHEACDALAPPVHRNSPPRGVRPRDEHGRFVAYRAARPHPDWK